MEFHKLLGAALKCAQGIKPHCFQLHNSSTFLHTAYNKGKFAFSVLALINDILQIRCRYYFLAGLFVLGSSYMYISCCFLFWQEEQVSHMAWSVLQMRQEQLFLWTRHRWYMIIKMHLKIVFSLKIVFWLSLSCHH